MEPDGANEKKKERLRVMALMELRGPRLIVEQRGGVQRYTLDSKAHSGDSEEV